MANPTSSTQPDSRARSHQNAYVVTDATQIYGGMLVGLKAGRLVPWLGTDGALSAPGIAQFDVLGDTSAGDPPRCRVIHGETIRGVTVAGAVATSVGALVYAADANAETAYSLTSDTAGAVGVLSNYEGAANMEVSLYSLEGFLNQ